MGNNYDNFGQNMGTQPTLYFILLPHLSDKEHFLVFVDRFKNKGSIPGILGFTVEKLLDLAVGNLRGMLPNDSIGRHGQTPRVSRQTAVK